MSWIKDTVKKIGGAISGIPKLLGKIFTSFYKQAEETLDNLPQDVKDALQHGTGVFAVINTFAAQGVAVIREEIKKEYPDIDEAKLEEGLLKVAAEWGLGTFSSLDEGLQIFTDHLSQKEGKVWAIISFTFSAALAVFLAPPATKVQIVTNLAETAYQKWVKPIFDKKAQQLLGQVAE